MATPIVSAYIGLGANIEEPIKQLQHAVTALNQHADISVTQCSRIYCSAAYGVTDQDDFFNAVIEVSTSLSAIGLLNVLIDQELEQGRVRERHWGPRCIDLDLLCYHNETWCSNTLVLPHPGIALRRFVLLPLQELAPQFALNQKTIETLIEDCEPQQLHVVNDLALSIA